MIIFFLFGFLDTGHVPLLQKAGIPLMIDDNVTQNVAPARSRHLIEPLLSVSYTANPGLKIWVLRVKILPDYAYYASVIKPLAWSAHEFRASIANSGRESSYIWRRSSKLLVRSSVVVDNPFAIPNKIQNSSNGPKPSTP